MISHKIVNYTLSICASSSSIIAGATYLCSGSKRLLDHNSRQNSSTQNPPSTITKKTPSPKPITEKKRRWEEDYDRWKSWDDFQQNNNLEMGMQEMDYIESEFPEQQYTEPHSPEEQTFSIEPQKPETSYDENIEHNFDAEYDLPISSPEESYQKDTPHPQQPLESEPLEHIIESPAELDFSTPHQPEDIYSKYNEDNNIPESYEFEPLPEIESSDDLQKTKHSHELDDLVDKELPASQNTNIPSTNPMPPDDMVEYELKNHNLGDIELETQQTTPTTTENKPSFTSEDAKPSKIPLTHHTPHGDMPSITPPQPNHTPSAKQTDTEPQNFPKPQHVDESSQSKTLIEDITNFEDRTDIQQSHSPSIIQDSSHPSQTNILEQTNEGLSTKIDTVSESGSVEISHNNITTKPPVMSDIPSIPDVETYIDPTNQPQTNGATEMVDDNTIKTITPHETNRHVHDTNPELTEKFTPRDVPLSQIPTTQEHFQIPEPHREENTFASESPSSEPNREKIVAHKPDIANYQTVTSSIEKFQAGSHSSKTPLESEQLESSIEPIGSHPITANNIKEIQQEVNYETNIQEGVELESSHEIAPGDDLSIKTHEHVLVDDTSNNQLSSPQKIDIFDKDSTSLTDIVDSKLLNNNFGDVELETNIPIPVMKPQIDTNAYPSIEEKEIAKNTPSTIPSFSDKELLTQKTPATEHTNHFSSEVIKQSETPQKPQPNVLHEVLPTTPSHHIPKHQTTQHNVPHTPQPDTQNPQNLQHAYESIQKTLSAEGSTDISLPQIPTFPPFNTHDLSHFLSTNAFEPKSGELSNIMGAIAKQGLVNMIDNELAQKHPTISGMLQTLLEKASAISTTTQQKTGLEEKQAQKHTHKTDNLLTEQTTQGDVEWQQTFIDKEDFQIPGSYPSNPSPTAPDTHSKYDNQPQISDNDMFVITKPVQSSETKGVITPSIDIPSPTAKTESEGLSSHSMQERNDDTVTIPSTNDKEDNEYSGVSDEESIALATTVNADAIEVENYLGIGISEQPVTNARQIVESPQKELDIPTVVEDQEETTYTNGVEALSEESIQQPEIVEDQDAEASGTNDHNDHPSKPETEFTQRLESTKHDTPYPTRGQTIESDAETKEDSSNSTVHTTTPNQVSEDLAKKTQEMLVLLSENFQNTALEIHSMNNLLRAFQQYQETQPTLPPQK